MDVVKIQNLEANSYQYLDMYFVKLRNPMFAAEQVSLTDDSSIPRSQM